MTKTVALLPSKSFIKNCLISGRAGDAPLFDSSSGGLVVRLDGYAIVPLEKYRDYARNAKRLAKMQGRT